MMVVVDVVVLSLWFKQQQQQHKFVMFQRAQEEERRKEDVAAGKRANMQEMQAAVNSEMANVLGVQQQQQQTPGMRKQRSRSKDNAAQGRLAVRSTHEMYDGALEDIINC